MHYLDPSFLIQALGTVGVIAIVFAESGLFFGFFLPGDSLLFTAGLLATQGHAHIGVLLVGTACAAILGDSVGYAFGKKIGSTLFLKEDSFFFKKKYIEHTQKFYEKHGVKTIILARFVPVVRTFAPILAGVGRMPYNIFLRYNIIGGILWSAGLLLLGYLLGKTVPNIDAYLLPIIGGIVFISVLPGIFHMYREWRLRRA